MKERLKEVYRSFLIRLMRVKNQKDDVVMQFSLSAVNNNLVSDSFDGTMREGFDIFILLNTLADSN